MGGKNKKQKVKVFPFVSVCTPTFNRRPFISMMFECFNNQTYPKDRIEWIIVDDGTDKIKDLVNSSNISQIKYFPLEQKMTLGAKRNFMHTKSSGSIIVYMDDDDYYPPERIEHAVDRLQKNRGALCAGSSELYIYFKHIQQMYQCGPYGPNHATAGTFAFRKELLNITKYNENASLAEEKEFLNNYTIPFVQLDPMKTILVFSHNHNTFDKKKMLINANETYTKPSDKTVELFIKRENEANIKKFFLTDIDEKLEKYAPGVPEMKPDVLKQIKELEETRKKVMEEKQQQAAENLTVQINGGTPEKLNLTNALQIIKIQQNDIDVLKKRIQELENQVNSNKH